MVLLVRCQTFDAAYLYVHCVLRHHISIKMGRKKKKAVEEAAPEGSTAGALPPPPPPQTATTIPSPAVVDDNSGKDKGKKDSSGYAMTSHSAEIVDEDYYVSDGSEDEEDELEVELVLAGSRMGVMRRGIHHPMLVQPNRQWTREDTKAENTDDAEKDEEAEAKRLKEEEELAKLDPAQRAARLLAQKQKLLEEAKVTARRLESEENAGRDPCLFSKRTAFDIRFDQIDDKPWVRGAGDFTDFFNYGLTEEDWLEYSQQQLTIRQELSDAARAKRPPDPTLVPVTPRAPAKQTPKVAVAVTTGSGDAADETAEGDAVDAVIGPVLVQKEGGDNAPEKSAGPDKAEEKFEDIHVGAGGAWGAGAAPGSFLAKLIEEQEQKNDDKKEPENPSRTDDANSKYGPNITRGAPSGAEGYSSYDDSKSHGGYGGRDEWNNRDQDHHGGHFGHQPQQQEQPPQHNWNSHNNDFNHRGGRGRGRGGGRGYMDGGRGGRGGGRGGFRQDHSGRGYMDRGHGDRGGGGRDRSHHDDGGSYRGGGGGHRKRQRDYDDRGRY